MSDWDNLVEPARGALEALLREGDDMAARIEELEAKLAKAVADHAENARILGHVVDEAQGQIAAGKLAALEKCRERSAAIKEIIGENT